MKLVVNQDCCSCSYCYRACPVGAPYYDGEQTRIDQEKCISCGKCVKKCPMGAIYDSENPPKPMEPHGLTRYDCDAVIIGAGGSGMIAACRIAETGKKVIVLEKAKRTGAGAIHVAGPLQFFDTKWALEAGAEPVVEQKILDTIAISDKFNPKLVENTLRAMPRFFDWLSTFAPVEEKFELVVARAGGPPPMPMDEDDGPGMPPPGDMPGPGPEGGDAFMPGAGTGMPGSGMGGNTGLVVDTKSLNPPSPAFHNAGEFIMDHLFAYAEKLGVTILTETPAKHLILDEAGNVIGVKASDPGGEVEINSKVCLVAAGSLLLSDALKKVQPDYADAWMPRFAHAINAYTGDGFEMCREAGVPVRYEDIFLNITGALVMPCDALTVEYAEATGKTPLINTALRTHGSRAEGLKVNLNGERFENEQYANVSVKYQIKQPGCVSYTILPEEIIKQRPFKTQPLYDENGNKVRQMVPMMIEPWNQENMDWWASRKGGHLIVADTIKALAEKAGMPVDTLVATVNRYNELCHRGVDEDYGKHPALMIPLEKGPFYAVRTFLMSDGAEGGIPIDESCRVIGENGPVSGLYASGDNSSGNIVDMDEDGQRTWITNEYSWALCSGMIAGDAMAAALK